MLGSASNYNMTCFFSILFKLLFSNLLSTGLHIYIVTGKLKLSLQEAVEVHRIVSRRGSHTFYKIGSQMAVRLSALSACRSLLPRKLPGIHFCRRLSRPQGHITAGRVRSNERISDLIWNRTSDLPACNIVPQPTTLSCAPEY
jgi:hypothetical protein